MGQKLNVMYLHLAKISIYAKKYELFYYLYLKDSPKYWCQKKFPPHTCLIQPMDSLLEGCGDVSVWEQSDPWWAVSDLLRACRERWGVLFMPGPWPQHKADLPWGHLLPPHPQSSEGSLCSVGSGLVVTELTGTAGPSPTQKSEQGAALPLFLISPLRKAFPTEAFLPISVRVFLYMSKKTREPGPGWHLRNPAAG